MLYQLDYRHILPRQSQQQTTPTVASPVVTPTGISSDSTTVVNVLTTATDLGLSATGTSDPAVRRASSLFSTKSLADPLTIVDQ